MNLNPIILVMAAATAPVAVAQINSPLSAGYAARAAEMLSDGNFQGCIDQCKVAASMGATNREQLDWMSAVASFRGNFQDAKSKLIAFSRQYPFGNKINSAKLMIAVLEFREEKFSEALKLFEAINPKALNNDEAEDLAYHTAFCQIKLGRNDEALKQLKSIEDSKKYKDAAIFYKAYIFYSEENYAEALTLFEQCNRQTEPGNMADYYIAQIYFKQENYSDAINMAMPLLSRNDVADGFVDEIKRIVGECLYELGRNSQAMEYLRPYVEKYPTSSPLSTRYIVGTEFYQLGDYDKAIDLLTPVAELKDEMGQSAALTLGQSYHALGNIKAAILAYDKAVHSDFVPRLTEQAYYNYAVAQIDGGRVPFGSSVATLEEYLKRYPNSRYAEPVKEYLMKGYMATGDYEGALKALESLAGSESEDVLNARQQVNFVLGTRALQSGNAPKAKEYLKESLKFSSRNAEVARQAHLWLGDALYSMGDYAQALTHYNEYLKVAPGSDSNRAIAQYNLAYCYFGLKDYEAARTQFMAAESSRSLGQDAAVDCLNRIADTYYYLRDFKTAAETYKRAYDRDPSVGDYSLYQYAIMEGNMGKADAKLAALEDMINTFPTSALRSSALMEKAVTLTSLGKRGEAIAVYEQVISQYPATSQGRNSLLQLAIVNVNDGKENVAIDYYKQLIERHPTSAEAAIAVRDLTRIYGDNGNIEELNTFLEGVADAPQLDAVERNAIAAAGLLKTARTGADDSVRLAAALELLEKYPDAEGAENALNIAAEIEYLQGMTDRALQHYTQLEESASTVKIRHTARMGILRAARDMGLSDKIIAVSDNILSSSAGSSSDIQEVKFIRAGAFADKGNEAEALTLWTELAQTPSELFGARAAFELADYYYRVEELDKAAKTAESLIDSNPPHPYWLARTYILYSDVLRKQGSDFEADEYLRVLRSNYPGTENDIFLMIDKRLPQQ